MRTTLFLALVAAAAVPASAQRDFSKVEIKVEQLSPGVAVLIGSGGNIGLSHGKDGNVLIDDQFAPLTEKIRAAIATVDPDPVEFVINTHWHGDHTGGNENFGKAGAVIMAHDNVRKRLAAGRPGGDNPVPPAPEVALPVVTYADGVTIHLNSDTLHIIHVANAHTDGDSLVHWQKSDVLHMGDTFFHKISFPFVDLNSGGSIDGMIAAANRGLDLAGPNTRIIPGHGPMASPADLVVYRDMLVDIRTKVAAAIAAGRTLEQIKAARPAAPYGMPDGFITPEKFVEAVFMSLQSPPQSASHSHGGAAHDH